MRNTRWKTTGPAKFLAALIALGTAATASAEMYVGAGIGKADVTLDSFHEDDSAQKLILGYIFDLPAVDLSFEASYVDFGTPRDSAAQTAIEFTGIDAFAVAGVDFGLVGLFAKAGTILWDADAVAPGFSASDDGTDTAYGVGIRFNVRSLEIRTEYEKFDIDVADDLDMLSASIIWRF